jgi:MFS family permease
VTQSEEAAPGAMRRVALASMVGTTIEFYDFFIYGTAAALVFNRVFFPAMGAASGTALALATFGVAFVARPFGSILFGHYGDRLGRKGTLVTTLLTMGISTLAIGLLPSAAAIGVTAPIILVLLRILQGLAVGGEWAGAVLLTAENAPTRSRGKFALWPQLGPSIAFALASATFLITTLTMSSESFLAWGWRVPFIASVVLVGVGLYVRLKLTETTVFTSIDHTKTRLPIAEALTSRPRAVLLGALATTTTFTFFYIGVTYLTTYGTTELKLTRPTVLALGIAGGAAMLVTTILSANLADRIGRRRILTIGCAAAVVAGIIAFPIIDIGAAWSFGVGLCLVMAVAGLTYGVLGSLLPELFPTRYRYTGAGISYNLAGVLGGGVVPLVAAALVPTYGSLALGIILTVVAAIGLACTLALPNTNAESFAEQDKLAAASR